MPPQFPHMVEFGGSSSNAFGQMPTGAAPTPINSTNYPQMNSRASLNTNGYGRLQHLSSLYLHGLYFSFAAMDFRYFECDQNFRHP